MAIAKSAPPDEEIRELLTVRDGWLWWNAEAVAGRPGAHKFNTTKPIGYGNTLPLVKFKGRQYHVSRLNYWFNTGEWPDCVIHKDTDRANSHIDNLIGGTASQANAIRRFDKRTYSIVERVLRDGRRRYYADIKLEDGKGKKVKRCLGAFDTELEALRIAINTRKLLFGEFASADYKESF